MPDATLLPDSIARREGAVRPVFAWPPTAV
jgi:hypothetical protein